MHAITHPRTFVLFLLGCLLVVKVTTAATVPSSLYIPFPTDAVGLDTSGDPQTIASPIGVDSNGRTTWLLQPDGPTTATDDGNGLAMSLTLVEGPTEAVIVVDTVISSVTEEAFVSCAINSGQALCAVGGSSAGVVTTESMFSEAVVATAILLDNGNSGSSGSSGPSATGSSGPSNPSATSSSGSLSPSPTGSAAQPTNTSKNSAMRGSPSGALLVVIGVLSYFAL